MKKFDNFSTAEKKEHIYVFAFDAKRLLILMVFLFLLPFAAEEQMYGILIVLGILTLCLVIVWFFTYFLFSLVFMVRFFLYADIYLNPKLARYFLFLAKILLGMLSVLFLLALSSEWSLSYNQWMLLVFAFYIGMTLFEMGIKLKNNDLAPIKGVQSHIE